MPRKTTPQILNESPAAEETAPAPAVDLIPEPELVKETITQMIDQVTGDLVQVTQAEIVETSPEGLRIEEINIIEEVTETAQGVAGAVIETFEVQEIPVPDDDEEEGTHATSPLFKPMRTILLAGLGLASYAIEESLFVIGKLVERGELTQKEGAKLVHEMTKKARLPLPSLPGLPGIPGLRGRKHKDQPTDEEMAEEGAGSESSVESDDADQAGSANMPAVETAEAAVPEAEEEGLDSLKRNVIISLNLFSPGANFRLPVVKKTDPEQK